MNKLTSRKFLTVKTLTYIFLFILCSCSPLSAQPDQLNMIVSVRYDNVLLGEALKDLSDEYQINFSYSRRYIPLETSVYCNVSKEPLYVALDEMFDNVAVSYTQIGKQIVLRVDKDKRIGQLEKELEDQYNPAIYDEIVVIQESVVESAPSPVMPSVPEQIDLENEMIAGVDVPFDLSYKTPVSAVQLNQPHPSYESSYTTTQLRELKASFTIVPKVSAHINKSENGPTNTSVNILFGKTENVVGLEIGLFVNVVTNDVEGVQYGGAYNFVRDDVEGLQMSGMVNVIGDDLKGVQIGGIFNRIGGDVDGVSILKKGKKSNSSGFQLAGIANRINGNLNGWQVAGITNKVGQDSKGVQLAGVCNKADGDANIQVSSICNRAGYVKKMQMGFINICDSIADGGTSIGLINIVKGGRNSYNRLEVSGGMALHANAALKFGGRRFYNQIKTGMRFTNGHNTWALGYGLGTTLRMNPEAHFNFEFSAMHINEGEAWTNTLNMLNVIQITYDHRITEKASFFVGPSFNFMTSERKNAEGVLIGSEIAPYSIDLDPTSTAPAKNIFWVGLNAGIRF